MLPLLLGLALAMPVSDDIPKLEKKLEGEASAVPLRKMHENGLLSDEEYAASLQELDGKRFQLPFRISAAPGKGATIGTLDDKFSLNVRSRFVTRAILTGTTQRSALELRPLVDNATKTARSSTFDVQIRTLRLWFSGNVLTPDVKYNIQLALAGLDYEAGNSSPVFDAWIEYTRWRDINLRVGQFFVPFDRARTIREFSLQFPDRQQVVQELTLDRDVGFELSSKDFLGLDGRLSYFLFIGTGEGRNRTISAVPGLLTSARVSFRPFGAFDDDSEGDLERSFKPRLALGAATAFNHNAVRTRGTTGNALNLGSFNYFHGVLDAVIKFGGFSLLTEALVRSTPDQVLRWKPVHEGKVGGVATKEWSRSGVGVVLQGGMMLTDHIEVTGRFDRLWALPNTDPALKKLADEQGTELGSGVNVYLNGHRFKVQADYQVQLAENLLNPAKHVARVHLDGMF